jgi:hypothetical protein
MNKPLKEKVKSVKNHWIRREVIKTLTGIFQGSKAGGRGI